MTINKGETGTMTNEDRLDTNIRQAKAINRGVLIVALLVAALLVGWNWPTPTHAAPLPTAGAMDYDTGENPRDIGDWSPGVILVDRTFAHKRWPVARVVRQLQARGVPVKVGRCWDRDEIENCVTVSSDRYGDTGPTGRRLGEVSLWSTNGVLDAADISLDDRDGKKASKSKRERKLRSYILQAAGR